MLISVARHHDDDPGMITAYVTVFVHNSDNKNTIDLIQFREKDVEQYRLLAGIIVIL